MADPLSQDLSGDGTATGRTVARYDDVELQAGQRAAEHFGSLCVATSYARGFAGPTAVTEENGRYIVYGIRTVGPSGHRDFALSSVRAANPDGARVETLLPGLQALVTTDRYIVYTDPRNGQWDEAEVRAGPQIEWSASPLGPFAGHVYAYGPGLAQVADPDAFLRRVGTAMRDTAFWALRDSRWDAEAVLGRMEGRQLSADDRTEIDSALTLLLIIDEQIATRARELERARRAAAAAVREHECRLSLLKARRAEALGRVPLLWRIGDLAAFQAASADAQAQALHAAATAHLADLEATRALLESGTLDLWRMDCVRHMAIGGLEIADADAARIESRGEGERRGDADWRMVETVLMARVGSDHLFLNGREALWHYWVLGATAVLRAIAGRDG